MRLAYLLISVLVHFMLKWWAIGWASILLQVFIKGFMVIIMA